MTKKQLTDAILNKIADDNHTVHSAKTKFFEYMGLIVSDALATVVESHT